MSRSQIMAQKVSQNTLVSKDCFKEGLLCYAFHGGVLVHRNTKKLDRTLILASYMDNKNIILR